MFTETHDNFFVYFTIYFSKLIIMVLNMLSFEENTYFYTLLFDYAPYVIIVTLFL